jgi:hypothetical protein
MEHIFEFAPKSRKDKMPKMRGREAESDAET